jgi:anthranilate phosphoribosyltransferase
MKEMLKKLVTGDELKEKETSQLFDLLLTEGSEVTDAQIGAYLALTSSREITSSELIGATKSLRNHMSKVDLPGLELADSCGTGGSGMNTFNTSTAVAFVVAASGQPVAKHGNRASTSKSGSADVLRALGINIELSPSEVAECIKKTNFGFMFAPLHHGATKRVQQIRRELGFRTIFNFLGPLANPAGAVFPLLGVSSRDYAPKMAEALLALGTKRAMVVHGADGLDEITLTGKTFVYEASNGKASAYQVCPEDFGLKSVSFSEIEGAEPEESAKQMISIFNGLENSKADLVAINAGALFYLSGKSRSIAEGVKLAKEVLASGKAKEVLDNVIKFTNSK